MSTSAVKPSAKGTGQTGTAYTYNYYEYPQDHGDFAAWLAAGSTLGLLLFALWQMHFVKRTTTAAENAAQAARDAVIATNKYVQLTEQLANTTKESVALARMALFTERPYLSIIPTNVEASPIGPMFEYVIRNDGNRPAILRQLRIGTMWGRALKCPSKDERWGAVTSYRINDFILASGGTSRSYQTWYKDKPPDLLMVSNEEMLHAISDQREQSNRELHLFGFIEYTDPTGTRYGVEFCWQYTVFATLSSQFYLDVFIDHTFSEA